MCRSCTNLEALDGDGSAGPACAQTAQISLNTYGNVLGEANEDEGEWTDDLEGSWHCTTRSSIVSALSSPLSLS